jgi:hypothetical protein
VVTAAAAPAADPVAAPAAKSAAKAQDTEVISAEAAAEAAEVPVAAAARAMTHQEIKEKIEQRAIEKLRKELEKSFSGMADGELEKMDDDDIDNFAPVQPSTSSPAQKKATKPILMAKKGEFCCSKGHMPVSMRTDKSGVSEKLFCNACNCSHDGQKTFIQ